jgi:hypothetical protein
MTQKELLLIDLSARLPHEVKVTWDGKHPLTVTPYIYCAIASEDNINNLPKLLLRSMSSMTDEEKNELGKISCEGNIEHKYGIFYRSQDYLNSIHVDYRGLIEKGLAIAVTKENNPYK